MKGLARVIIWRFLPLCRPLRVTRMGDEAWQDRSGLGLVRAALHVPTHRAYAPRSNRGSAVAASRGDAGSSGPCLPFLIATCVVTVAGGACIDAGLVGGWDSDERKGPCSHEDGENPAETGAGECCTAVGSTVAGSPWQSVCARGA